MATEDFNYQTLELKDDYEGKAVATLIHSNKNSSGRIPILYIHGFSDYFYHPHLANWANKNEMNFYALELRKYGRSILPHQHPNYCKNLKEYFEEISMAISIIIKECDQKIILMGHSNGGLISSLYANIGEKKELIQQLILNAPFLSLNEPWITKNIAIPIVGFISKIFPFLRIPDIVTSLYPKSIDIKHYGEWEINYDWKPINGFPGYFLWMLAVRNAQKYLEKKSNINIPVLILHSSNSMKPRKWNPAILESDIILNIDDIKRIGLKLGNRIDIIEIDKAMHDVFLSKKEVRDSAFGELINWINSIKSAHN